MAWVVTNRGTVQHLNSSANTVIPSFTPGANKLLLAWIAGYLPSPSSVSGHGTWTHISSVTVAWGNGGTAILRLYACKTGGSPSASAVTFTHGPEWTRCAGCIEIDEDTVGLPEAVADCFGLPVGNAEYTDNAPPHIMDITLGEFASENNMTVQVLAVDSGSNATFTPEAGWQTLVHKAGTAQMQGGLAYKTTADTSPACSSNLDFTYTAALAVEVKAASGGPSVPTISNVSDTTLTNGQTGVVITGAGFSASGNTVLISPTDDVEDAEAVAQTITAEGATEITFTAVLDDFEFGETLYLFVVNDDGDSNADGEAVSRVVGSATLTATFIDKNDQPLTELSDIKVSIWHAGTIDGAPDEQITGEVTDESGVFQTEIEVGTLEPGDKPFVVVEVGSPPTIWTCGLKDVDYQ